MDDIKPIETIYKGCRFRSRLEARWAVFFDSIGIEWEYEPEGFELPDGTRYLPDFYLKKSKTYAEVKPPREGCAEEIKKAARFVSESGIKRLLILSNIPELDKGWPHHPLIYYDNLWQQPQVEYVEFPQGPGWCVDYAPDCSPPYWDEFEHWIYEIKCGETYYSDANTATEKGIAKMYEKRAIQYIKIDGAEFDDNAFTYEHYARARAARFEFGEEG